MVTENQVLKSAETKTSLLLYTSIYHFQYIQVHQSV